MTAHLTPPEYLVYESFPPPRCLRASNRQGRNSEGLHISADAYRNIDGQARRRQGGEEKRKAVVYIIPQYVVHDTLLTGAIEHSVSPAPCLPFFNHANGRYRQVCVLNPYTSSNYDFSSSSNFNGTTLSCSLSGSFRGNIRLGSPRTRRLYKTTASLLSATLSLNYKSFSKKRT